MDGFKKIIEFIVLLSGILPLILASAILCFACIHIFGEEYDQWMYSIFLLIDLYLIFWMIKTSLLKNKVILLEENFKKQKLHTITEENYKSEFHRILIGFNARINVFGNTGFAHKSQSTQIYTVTYETNNKQLIIECNPGIRVIVDQPSEVQWNDYGLQINEVHQITIEEIKDENNSRKAIFFKQHDMWTLRQMESVLGYNFSYHSYSQPLIILTEKW